MNERGSYKYRIYMKNVLYLVAEAKRTMGKIGSCPHLFMCLNVVLFMER